jgi:hypothetical protein
MIACGDRRDSARNGHSELSIVTVEVYYTHAQ